MPSVFPYALKPSPVKAAFSSWFVMLERSEVSGVEGVRFTPPPDSSVVAMKPGLLPE